MSVVLRVRSAPSGWIPDAPRWVKSCDVDAFDGGGYADLTGDITTAVRFDGPVAALRYWKRQSTVRPIRPDGGANRPLTAFTVEIEEYR